MKWTHLRNVSLCFGTMTMLFGSAALAQSASSSSKGVDESQKAARFLRDIRADAIQVRAAAVRLDNLTRSSSPTWLEYDRQWNEIKPSVEDMQIKIASLESMEASISAAERSDVDQSKLLVQEIQARTHQLRTLLDKPGVQTTDVKFKTCAGSLKNEAGKLEKTASVS